MTKMKDLKVLYIFAMFNLFSCVLCQTKVISLNLPEGAKCQYGTVNGTCVNIFRCLSVLRTLNTGEYQPLCSYNGNDPIICCTDCTLVDDIRELTYMRELGVFHRKAGQKADRKCLEYLEKLPYPCKFDTLYSGDFVWGDWNKCTSYESSRKYEASSGVDAKREEFPHMALLGYGDDLDSAQYLCGGTIVSERFILTAAHCIASALLGPVKYIALGILKRSDPPSYWKRYGVQRIIKYPQYQSPSKYHDIALLETDREIVFDKTVLPACLYVEEHQVYDGILEEKSFYEIWVQSQVNSTMRWDDFGYATGWGRLGEDEAVADILQKVLVEKYKDEDCSRLYQPHRHMRNGYDNSTQICYGDKRGRQDTCSGDSGGPIQASVKANFKYCQWTVLAVVSSGNRCGTLGGAGLYTRVQYYMDWIESVVWP